MTAGWIRVCCALVDPRMAAVMRHMLMHFDSIHYSASHHGTLYQLSYYGPGSLYGFGYDTQPGIPEVNLEDGTLLENVIGSYVTKALEIGWCKKLHRKEWSFVIIKDI